MSERIYLSPNIAHFLRGVLRERCLRNPRYSMRALARDLELTPSYLSRVLTEKLQLAADRTADIGQKLGLEGQDLDYFRLLGEAEGDREASLDLYRLRRNLAFQAAALLDFGPEQNLEVMKLWMCFSYLGSDHSPERLGLSAEAYARACENFLSRGWLTKTSKGRLKPSVVNLESPAGPCPNKRAMHRHCLDLSRDALELIPFDERSFLTTVMGADRKRRAEIFAKIQEVLKAEIDQYQDRESHTTLYTVALQIVPLMDLPKPLTV